MRFQTVALSNRSTWIAYSNSCVFMIVFIVSVQIMLQFYPEFSVHLFFSYMHPSGWPKLLYNERPVLKGALVKEGRLIQSTQNQTGKSFHLFLWKVTKTLVFEPQKDKIHVSFKKLHLLNKRKSVPGDSWDGMTIIPVLPNRELPKV